MSLFTKLKLGMQKEVKVNKIPQDMLAMKSSKKVNDFITLYYLNKGKTLLSVLNDEENNILEVIRKLDTLNDYFHLAYDNLIISKSTNKLLAFSYPFELLISKDLDTVKKLISEDNQETYDNISDYVSNNNKEELKYKLTKVLFIYKVLMYLNKNGISVKQLTLNDINRGSLDGNIYAINAISKLDLIDEDEEAEIVDLCFSYIVSQELEERLGVEFKKYLADFERDKSISSLFEEKLNAQIKNITNFSCGHEWDASFFRCPYCNSKDVIISTDEILRARSYTYKLKDEKLELYGKKTLNCKYDFLLFSDLVTNEDKDIILEYLGSQNESNYGIIYDEEYNFVGLRILFEEIGAKNSYKNVKKYLNALLKNKEFPKDSKVWEFCYLFKAIFDELLELHGKNFAIKEENNELLDQFIIIDNTNTSIFVKPTSIVKKEDFGFQNYEIVAKALFNYINEVNNNKVLELLDPIIYIEYDKFVNNNQFDAQRVYNRLDFICSNKQSYSHLEKYGYSDCYKASPLSFKTDILKEESSTALVLPEYELVEEDINTSKIENAKNLDIILPERILYKECFSDIKYLGYVIKKTEGHLVKEVFSNIGKYDNKAYIKMLIVYLDLLESKSDYPIDYAYFTKDFSEVFFKYNNSESDSIKVKEFFSNIVHQFDESSVYMSDALEIVSDSDNLVTKWAKNKLNLLLNSFTNYCKDHNTWYEGNLKRCPICSKYYLYLDNKYLKKRKIIYENELCTLLDYKRSRRIKLFKAQNGKLINGKSVAKIEKEILDILELNSNTNYLKLIKEDVTEETIGILVTKSSIKSLKEVLDNPDNTNITYLAIAKKVLDAYGKICFGFKELSSMSLDKFFSEKLYYISKEVTFIDLELYEKENINPRLNPNFIVLLDKIVRYILSYNNKCDEFESIEYPELDADYIYNMKSIFSDLKNHLNELCKKHNVYYNPEDGMCPLCAAENPNEVIIEDKSQLGKQVGFGGESNVLKFGLKNLVKIYKGEVVDKNVSPELREATLNIIREKINKREEIVKLLKELYIATKKELMQTNFGIVFAQKPVYLKGGNKKVFAGYLQEKIKDPMSFSLLTNKKKCEELGLDTVRLLKLLIEFGEGIEYLHNSPTIRKIVPEGIVVGDINGRNALYSKYEKKIYLIDTDSIGTKKYKNYIFTPKFSDPIIREKSFPDNCSTFDSDWYSYAILCFFVLTKLHPFEGVYQKRNGTKMDVVERMEKRISVVGNHQIVLPDVVVDWNWMSYKLISAFLDIFEKDKRFSILDLLKEEYNLLSGVNEYYLNETSEISENAEVKESVEDVYNDLNTKSDIVNCSLKINKLASMNGTLELLSSKLNMIDEKVFYNGNLICDKFLSLDVYSDESLDLNLKIKSIEEHYVKDGNGIFTAIDYSGYKYIFRLKNKVPKAIYRMSSAKRRFGILYDELNDMYLLIAYDNTKSYVIINEKVAKLNDIYDVVDFEKYTILYKYISNCDVSKLSYIGNTLYYLMDGAICNINLVDNTERKVACNIASEGGFIKFIDNKFIIGSKEGIFEIAV